jgi:hypothetical protein
MVGHIHNPSSSGGETEDRGSLRLAQAKLVRPYLKNKVKAKGLEI